MPINPKVIDISHYQPVVDFVKVHASGIRGMIHKASEGLSLVDQFYTRHRGPATAAGLLWGAYHFIRPGDVRHQVELFLRVAKPDDHTLLALDYEVSSVTLAQAKAFMQLVEQETGHSCVMYSGNVIKEKIGARVDPWWGEHRLWLAQYGNHWSVPRPWHMPWLWQYTGDGMGPPPHQVHGIHGNIDISHWGGTDEELAAQWSGLHHPAQV